MTRNFQTALEHLTWIQTSTVILNPDTNHVLIRLTGCRRLTNAGLPMGCFPPRPRAVVGIGLAMLRRSLTAHSSAPSQTIGFQGEALAGARWEVPWAQTVVVWNEDSPCAVRAGDSPGQVCAAEPCWLDLSRPRSLGRPWLSRWRPCTASVCSHSPGHRSRSSQGLWMQW